MTQFKKICNIMSYLTVIVLSIFAIISLKFPIQENYQDDKLDSLVKDIKKVFSMREGVDEKDSAILKELSLDKVINNNALTFDGHDESYTINKKKVHICMKDEHDKYYEDDMLMYVLLHELAHCKCKSIGHTDEFHGILDNIYYIARRYDKDANFATSTRPILGASFIPDPDYCSYNK